MSDYYKVGDEVEVYNCNSTRKGKVVALLGFPDHLHPVVVEHETFNGKPGFERSDNTLFQRFSHEGVLAASSRQISIRRPKEKVVSNVYADDSQTFSPAMKWCSPEAARLTRAKHCVGYLEADRDSAGNITNVRYTSLEK